ncbi:virulence RhuM family protein [Porphyromonadaceae bacterium OttesenSCG-928-L07]|nr:virulence RhuM family protein [Porphyromonadaceae bacterium OttesenSCG-928-L07]
MAHPVRDRPVDTYTVTVANNLRSIFKSGVLREKRVTKTYHYKTDSGKEGITIFYNLDVIIALAYRIRSRNADIIKVWIPKMICKKKETVYMVLQYKASDKWRN